MRGVFDDSDLARGKVAHELADRHRQSCEMHGHDRPGAIGHCRLNRLERGIERDRIYVDKNRTGTKVCHDLRSGGESPGWHDEFVTRPNAERLEGEVQTCSR